MNNAAVRTISGIVFIAIVAACLLVNKYLFAALVIFITCTMLAEFYKMTMGDKYRFSRALAIAGGVTLFVLIFLYCAFDIDIEYVSLSMVPLFVVMLNSLLVKDKASEFSKFSYIYTGLLYIAIPLSLSNIIVFKGGEFSGMLLMSFFIIIWSSDVGAYCIGTAFGQKENSRKLAPSISPKKSWVGFWGGLAFAIAATLLLHVIGLLDIPFVHGIAVACLMHCGGVVGDLVESMWKRSCGVKDSGNIIPGHGGMLDRFDSAIVAMPLGAIYLALFNLI